MSTVTHVSVLLGRQHRLALRAVLGLQREMGRHEDMFRLTRRGRDLAVTVIPSGVIDGSRAYPELPRFGADENDLDGEWAS